MSKLNRIINNMPSHRGRRVLDQLYKLQTAESVPASGLKGYEKGQVLRLNNAVLGQAPLWINKGSETSSLFVPFGPSNGYGIIGGHGPISLGGDATEILYDKLIKSGDFGFVEHGVCDDNDQICAILPSDGALTLTLTADPTAGAKQYNWVALQDGVESEWDIFAAGTYDCLTADDTTVAITITGAEAGDIGMACYSVSDDTDLISDVVMTTDTMTITVSADPGTDGTHSWDYVVFRRRGDFKPSHYVAYAGVHTTVGGDTTEVITVTGALATDICLVKWHTTDDTDTIAKAVLTADTITVTLSADPSTAHKLAYMVLRAYE